MTSGDTLLLLRLAALSTIAMVACSNPPASDDGSTDTTDTTATTATTDTSGESETGDDEPAYEVQLDERACPFNIPAGRTAECLTAWIPLDRTQLQLGAVQLPVAIIHSSGAPTRPPVVYLHGGPGGAAFARAARWFDQPLSDDGDIIIFDQRGSGDSLPSLNCTEAEAAWFQSFSSALSPADEVATIGAAFDDCHTRLAEATVLDAFDSQANADDVEDLRRALGYDSWSLYGVSYGTRLALAVMRRHPDGVRNVVLDSVYPPAVGGVEWMLDTSKSALDRLIAGCLEEPGCGATFPNLEANLATAIAGLDTQPYMVMVQDSQGVMHDLSLTGADFYAGMYNALYDIDLIPLVPFLIFTAAQGDYSFLVDLANQSIPFLTAGSEGARLSIDCADGGPLLDASQLAGTIDANSAFSTLFAAHAVPFCAQWGVESAPAEFIEPVVSDIPTMILTGEFDPVTPVSQSELARDALGDAQLFVFPGFGHGPSFASACAGQMTAAFLRDSAVNSGCWSALPQDTF